MSLLKELNEATRSEIQTLWEKGDTKELERRMRPRIEFGTAGLRGKMEAGWTRYERLEYASQGLCQYVLSQVKDASSRGIVIGHDHRYNSERWAQLTAAVFLEHGVKVYLYRGLVHTPLVPFGVQRLNAACGVMITASHNPKNDNGYKVYWENAVQIIAPHDKGISDAIKSNLNPKTWSVDQVQSSPNCLDVTEDIKKLYFSAIEQLKLPQYAPSAQPIVFVNTSMHGVSHPFVTKALGSYGITVNPVKEQMLPDPDFPTVPFPNPEEKALDLAIEMAKNCKANYVLAQDPDSDRFSACELHSTGVTTFTGDQLGTIFAAQAFEIYRDSGKPLSKLAIIASTVSSKMVEAMAAKEGFKFVECLTGFKYIGNTALDIVEKGYEVPFGYEEAIGFMFGEVRDKDGVAASVMFAQLAETLHGQGRTVNSYLEDLYKRYGYFKTSNSYFICNDPQIVDTIFFRLRNYHDQKSGPGPNYPQSIAGLEITGVVDLTTGYDSSNPPSYEPSLPLSSGHMIQFRGEQKFDGTKIVLTIRTSGTEPKIKYYLEGSGKDSKVVSELLPRVVSELGSDWMQALVYDLGHP
ncbi:Phosphoglucomutase, first 3 domain-containing protein [Gymnopus androsaceus JB14]|uniref:Phosphoglucomutase, first 3 domain-containing protein n=1 Tax=Gymnopus androsaceus JB14 TaxID=1447944 RepID=A0A6A4ICT1_9AGAR|nr:Phosphoglucomutase, first 3 domain-containing protein [Gymnopus androsaceus JB14]